MQLKELFRATACQDQIGNESEKFLALLQPARQQLAPTLQGHIET